MVVTSLISVCECFAHSVSGGSTVNTFIIAHGGISESDIKLVHAVIEIKMKINTKSSCFNQTDKIDSPKPWNHSCRIFLVNTINNSCTFINAGKNKNVSCNLVV